MTDGARIGRRHGGGLWKFWLVLGIGLLLLVLYQTSASARSGGIDGYSGNPGINGGADCTDCHDGGTVPTVSISGPTTVDVGTTNTYTLTITGAQSGSNPRGGLDVSATSGTLVSIGGQGTAISAGELIHSTAKQFAGAGSISWNFQWTAPGTAGSATLYGAGLSGNGSGTGNDGTDTSSLAITVQEPIVNQPPDADAGGPYTGAIAELILFDASGSSDPDGTIDTYEWDFDGDLVYDVSLATPTVFHSYPAEGIYNVTLRVTDDQGDSATAPTQATIGPAANQPPTAVAGGPYSGTAGYPVQFDGTGSTDPEAGALTYSWDFGDGTPAGSGATPTHTYATDGSYIVTLTVTDPGLETDDGTATATIAINQPPTADAGGPYTGTSGSPVAFSGSGSDPEGGTITYSWDFGDGSPAESGPTPSHTYGAGDFTATLTVTDPAGAEATSTAGVTITGLSGDAAYADRCASCHGANGEGGIGPSLQASTLALGDIQAILDTGSMATYASGLSAGEIDSLAQFTKDLQVPVSTTTTLPADGGALYALKCAGCHGANGEGGIGPSLQNSTLSLADLAAVLSTGSMATYTSDLTPTQLDALTQFAKDLQVPAATTTTLPPDDGGAIYSSKCAGCHGADAAGTGLGPSLQASTLSLAQINDILTTGSMAGFATGLTAGQIDALATYVKSVQDTAATTTTTTLPAADGGAIYSSKCAGCHGADAAGTGLGPSLRVSTLSLSEINTLLTSGSMAGFASGLTSEQIDALSSYVKDAQDPAATTTTTTAPATVSGSALYSSQCASCHGASGQGGVGPSLQASTMSLSQTLAIVRNGGGAMPGFSSSLNNAQIDAVSRYSRNLQSSTATTTTLAAEAGGAEIYSAECAGCHGAGGEGGVGPSLQASTSSLSDLVAVITNGAGSMPGYSDTLSAEQIDAVADYSLSLQDSTVTTTTLPSGGAQLYVAWCSACHGDNGQGAIGPALVGLDLPTEEFVEITKTGAGAMHGFESTLTDEEIEVLAAYLFNLGQVGTPGAALGDLTDPAEMYSVGCGACHGIGGLGGIASAVAGTSLSVQDLITVITDGTEGMPAFGASLRSDQIGVLAEFITTLSGDGQTTATTTTLAGGTAVTPTGDGNSAAGLLVLVFGVLGGVTGGLILWRRRREGGLERPAGQGD